MNPFTLHVVTKIPPPMDRGNLALPMSALYIDTDHRRPVQHMPGGAGLLFVRQQVFTLGEILILDADGREPHARGRKPAKWPDVEVQRVASMSEAVELALQVLTAAAKEGDS